MAKDRTKERLLARRARYEPMPKVEEALSSGATTLNLALTGHATAGYHPGKYYHWVGDSDSGKSFLTMNAFAEASINPRFANYQLVYDDPENGVSMDVRRMFGRECARRLRPPRGTNAAPIHSSTMEEFYFNLDAAMDRGPVLYALDSLDALSSKADHERYEELKAAHLKNKNGPKAGTYGTGKAKASAGGMREVHNRLKKTGSILFILSQARHAMGFGFEDKTWSGGTALKFFCQAQLWLSVMKNLAVDVNGKKRNTGIMSLIRVKKNRQTGRKMPAKVPIYWSSGVDDVGGMIDFLLEEGHWKKTKGKITATELEVEGGQSALIKHIEENDLENVLRGVCQSVWDDVKRACTVERKRRYP